MYASLIPIRRHVSYVIYSKFTKANAYSYRFVSSQKNITTKNVNNLLLSNYSSLNRSASGVWRRIETNALSALVLRCYATNSKKNDEMEEATEVLEEVDPDSKMPATVAIPDVWPQLPVIATRRNPVFPRFMKIIEVNKFVGKIKFKIIKINKKIASSFFLWHRSLTPA